jgi:hypothetical protein
MSYCGDQQYWFNVPMDSNFYPDLYDDVSNHRIGILNSNPQYTLDVGGTTQTTNLIVNGLIQSSNILNSGVIQTDDILASNILTCNVDTKELHLYSSNYSTSNFTLSNFHDLLYINGYNVSEPFPESGGLLDIDWWLTSSRPWCTIHPSWVQDPDNVLGDLFEAGALGVEILDTLFDMSQFLNPAQTVIPQAMLDALDSALSGGNEDGSPDSNSVYVSWSNLRSKPIAVSNLDIGMKGNLYLDETKSIYSLNSGYITKQGRDNLSLLSTSGRDLLINVGTKDFFPNKVNIGNSNLYLDSNTIKLGSNISFNSSNTDFKIQNWNFTASSISCSNQNTYWQNRMYFSSNISAPLVNTDQIVSTLYGNVSFNSNYLKMQYQDDPTITEQRLTSYIYQYPTSLEFKTKDSTFNYGSLAPQVTQLSINSNGTLYVASNILMNNELRLRCASNDFIDYSEGQLRMEAEALRFYNVKNGTERVIASVNSNGLFLIDRSSVFGKYEYLTDPFLGTTYSNFPRLDVTLQSGLVFGSGISSNQWLANSNIDFFKITRNAELLTWASDCNQHYMSINSNAEIQKGTLKIDKWGGIKHGNSNLCLSNGTLQRSNVNYYPNGNVENSKTSTYLYNATTDIISCSKIGIGTSNPNKDFQIYSPSNECGVRVQSGETQLYITGKSNIQSTIAFYNKPLIIGRTTDGGDISGNTAKTMVFAVNDNIGINKLTPSYNLDIAGSFNACNIYENGILITDKFPSKSNFETLSNYTHNLTMSNTFTTCNIYADEVNAGGSILGAAGLAFAGAGGVGTAYLLNQQGQLASILQDSLTTGSKISIDPLTGICHATFGDFAYGKFGTGTIHLSNNQMIFTSNTTSNMILGSNSLTMYNNQPFTISNANLIVSNCNVGIGVASPQKNLHIQSSTETGIRCQSGIGATQTHLYMTAMDSNNSVIGYYGNPLIIGRTTNGASLYNNTQNTIVLTTGDQVGIGKSNPAYKLDVATTFNASNIYENGILLTSKYAPSNTLSNYVLTATGNSQYAPSNTLSNYGLKSQTDYTSNSLSNVLRNPTNSTIVNSTSPAGVYNGLIVNNSNINYGSGAGLVLQTGGNWGAKIYEFANGNGNYLNFDLTHGTTAYSNVFYGKNYNGTCTLGTNSLQLDDPTCGWRLKNGSSFFGNGSNMLISYLSNKNDDTTANDHFEIWQNGKVTIYNNCLNAVGYTTLSASYGYLNSSGSTGTITSQVNNYSIIATKRILCEEINVNSDERIKTEIQPFKEDLCMKLVNGIDQKHYKMKDDGSYKVGVIAQQLQKVFPNAVYHVPKDDIEDFRVVDYNQITALLVGAVKHLHAKVDTLTNEIKELKNKI